MMLGYTRLGFNSRYLTTVYSTGKLQLDYEAISNKIYAEMDAELRARKVTVDQNTHNDLSYLAEYGRRIGNRMTKEMEATNAAFEKDVTQYGNSTASYHMQALTTGDAFTYHTNYDSDPRVALLEVIQKTKAESQQQSPLANMQFYSVEKDMLRTQLAPGQTFDWKPGEPVPLVLSYPYLERLAGRSFANVDTATKNKAYKELIAAYAGTTLAYCHRNQAAQQQLQDVVTYNDTVTNDKDKTTNPIAIPVCGDFDQKQLKKLGIISEPSDADPQPLFKSPALPVAKTTRVQFKIVGFIPGQDQFNSDIISGIFTGISILPAATNPAIIPVEVTSQEPLFAQEGTLFGGTPPFLLFDFANRADQKAFLAKGCQGDECANSEKPYLAPFGNVSVALENIFDILGKIVIGVATGMMVIAALLILFNISKVIADSTKEIAVFRALGARRRDIAHIYYTYGGMLAVSSLLFAVIIGAVGAYAVNVLSGEKFAAALVQSVGAYTQNPELSLVGVEPMWLVGVALALSVAAVVGISIPVLAALKRRLITILREE